MKIKEKLGSNLNEHLALQQNRQEFNFHFFTKSVIKNSLFNN
jgi:hypothetical protein